MLTTSQLSLERNDKSLFDNMNLSIKAGDVVRVTGINGAGKTSLLRTLCGLTPATIGKICWQGEVITNCRELYQRDLLYIGHQNGLKRELTALENLSSMASGLGEVSAQDVLATVGLARHQDVLAEQLSAGQSRRLVLSRLKTSTAKLWILDEPFTALDTFAVAKVCDWVRDHAANGGIVIFTSHTDVPLTTTQSIDL